MNSAEKKPAARAGQPDRTRCGGWPTYQDWAEHDFRGRTAAEDESREGGVSSVVHVLTELLPITISDVGIPQPDGSRVACAVFPPPSPTGVAEEPWRVSAEWEPVVEDVATLVRPYVRAGGRVDAGYPLEFETILSATGLHETALADRELSDDQLVICANCTQPRSVAEIAAAINAPVGVAKVLISDALDQGLLVLHERTPCLAGRPPLELLKRVHAGIAKLA